MCKIILILVALLLTSCKNESVVPNTQNIMIHPSLPVPVITKKFSWDVLIKDDDVYVGLLYNDSLEFRLYLEDIKRYIQQQKLLLCFYRKELNECGEYHDKK